MNFQNGDEYLFASDRSRLLPPTTVYELRPAVVWTHPLVDYAGRRMEAVQRWSSRPFDPFGPFSLTTWLGGIRRRCTSERALLAYEGWSKNSVYHWLCDTLPRVLVAESVCGSDLDILLPESPHQYAAYQNATLDWMGWTGRRIRINSMHPVKTTRLFFVEPTAPAGEQRPGLINHLRSRLAPGLAGSPGKRKIYISRQSALSRLTLNEVEVQFELRAAGFEVFELENMSADEQRNLFHSASHIVATHGAALANLVYCRPGTRILEIRNALYRGFNCYFTLCGNLDLEFFYLKAKATQPERENQSDLSVDLASLSAVLKLFLNPESLSSVVE